MKIHIKWNSKINITTIRIKKKNLSIKIVTKNNNNRNSHKKIVFLEL